jgi:hypothetical protein
MGLVDSMAGGRYSLGVERDVEDLDDPRAVWRLTSGVSCEVRTGLVDGWLQAARRVGVALEWPVGVLGSYQSSQLSVQVANLRDALEEASEMAAVAMASSAVPLGEWWYRNVRADSHGVFIGEARVVSWGPAWCETDRGRARTSPVLLGFAARAEVRAVRAYDAWVADLDAVARAAGSAAAVGTLLLERVAAC